MRNRETFRLENLEPRLLLSAGSIPAPAIPDNSASLTAELQYASTSLEDAPSLRDYDPTSQLVGLFDDPIALVPVTDGGEAATVLSAPTLTPAGPQLDYPQALSPTPEEMRSDSSYIAESVGTLTASQPPPGHALVQLRPDTSKVTLRLDSADRLVLLEDLSGSLLLSVALSDLGSLDIRGSDLVDDFLTVDYSRPFDLAGGLSFHGGAGGFDTLAFFGGETSSVTYSALGPDGGAIQARDGLRFLPIAFDGLEPVFLNTSNVTFDSMGRQGAFDLTLCDVGGKLRLYGTIGGEPIEYVEFTSLRNLTINTETNNTTGNSDSISIYLNELGCQPATVPLDHIYLVTGSGDDAISLFDGERRTAPTSVHLVVDVGAGDDTIRADLGTSGLFAGTGGVELALDGGGGVDTFTLVGSLNYTIDKDDLAETGTLITGLTKSATPSLALAVKLQRMGSLLLQTGDADDSIVLSPFAFVGTATTSFTLDAGAGDDSITINAAELPSAAVAATISLDGGAGADLVAVKYAGAALSSRLRFEGAAGGAYGLLCDGALLVSNLSGIENFRGPFAAESPALTWAGGASLVWEINDATGGAGSDPGWDCWRLGSSTLTVSAGALNKFTLKLASLANLGALTSESRNTAGWMDGFDEGKNYSWKILEAASVVLPSGVGDINAVVGIDSTEIRNQVGRGRFSLSVSGGAVFLNFIHAPTSALAYVDGAELKIVNATGGERSVTSGLSPNDQVFLDDLTGEGIEDLVVVSPISGTIRVFSQLGDLMCSVEAGVLRDPGVGDVDGDGREEIVFIDQAGGISLVRLYETGASAFALSARIPCLLPSASFSLLQAADRLALGDLDGDLRDELVVLRPAASQTLSLYDVWGATLATATLDLAGARLGVGDMDACGSSEILLAGSAQSLLIEAGRGAGAWTLGAPAPLTGFSLAAADTLVLGDVDSEGGDELLVRRSGQPGTEVFDLVPGGTLQALPLTGFAVGGSSFAPFRDALQLELRSGDIAVIDLKKITPTLTAFLLPAGIQSSQPGAPATLRYLEGGGLGRLFLDRNFETNGRLYYSPFLKEGINQRDLLETLGYVGASASVFGTLRLSLDVAPGFTPFPLTASVGRGGVNASVDLLRLQQRLRFLGFSGYIGEATADSADLMEFHSPRFLQVTGAAANATDSWAAGASRADNDTLEAIKAFLCLVRSDLYRGQKFPLIGNTVAGLIEPNSEGHNWLNADNAPFWLRLEDVAGEFSNVDTSDPDRIFTSTWSAESFLRLGALASYPVVFTQLSAQYSGPDYTHSDGLAADLRVGGYWYNETKAQAHLDLGITAVQLKTALSKIAAARVGEGDARVDTIWRDLSGSTLKFIGADGVVLPDKCDAAYETTVAAALRALKIKVGTSFEPKYSEAEITAAASLLRANSFWAYVAHRIDGNMSESGFTSGDAALLAFSYLSRRAGLSTPPVFGEKLVDWSIASGLSGIESLKTFLLETKALCSLGEGSGATMGLGPSLTQAIIAIAGDLGGSLTAAFSELFGLNTAVEFLKPESTLWGRVAAKYSTLNPSETALSAAEVRNLLLTGSATSNAPVYSSPGAISDLYGQFSRLKTVWSDGARKLDLAFKAEYKYWSQFELESGIKTARDRFLTGSTLWQRLAAQLNLYFAQTAHVLPVEQGALILAKDALALRPNDPISGSDSRWHLERSFTEIYDYVKENSTERATLVAATREAIKLVTASAEFTSGTFDLLLPLSATYDRGRTVDLLSIMLRDPSTRWGLFDDPVAVARAVQEVGAGAGKLRPSNGHGNHIHWEFESRLPSSYSYWSLNGDVPDLNAAVMAQKQGTTPATVAAVSGRGFEVRSLGPAAALATAVYGPDRGFSGRIDLQVAIGAQTSPLQVFVQEGMSPLSLGSGVGFKAKGVADNPLDVARVQQALKYLGFYQGRVTGTLDDKTLDDPTMAALNTFKEIVDKKALTLANTFLAKTDGDLTWFTNPKRPALLRLGPYGNLVLPAAGLTVTNWLASALVRAASLLDHPLIVSSGAASWAPLDEVGQAVTLGIRDGPDLDSLREELIALGRAGLERADIGTSYVSIAADVNAALGRSAAKPFAFAVLDLNASYVAGLSAPPSRLASAIGTEGRAALGLAATGLASMGAVNGGVPGQELPFIGQSAASILRASPGPSYGDFLALGSAIEGYFGGLEVSGDTASYPGLAAAIEDYLLNLWHFDSSMAESDRPVHVFLTEDTELDLLELHIVGNISKVSEYALDVSSATSLLGIRQNGEASLAITTELRFDWSLGIDFSRYAADPENYPIAAENVFFALNRFEMRAGAFVSDLNFRADLGSLHAGIEEGMALFVIGLDISLANPLTGSSRLSCEDFELGNFTFGFSPFGSLALCLPIQAEFEGVSGDAAIVIQDEDLFDSISPAASVAGTLRFGTLRVGDYLDIYGPTLHFETSSAGETVLGLSAAAGRLSIGDSFSLSVTDTDLDDVAIQGSYNFTADQFTLSADRVSLEIPNLLSAEASGIALGYRSQGPPDQVLFHLDSLLVTIHPLDDLPLTLSSLTITNNGFDLGYTKADLGDLTLGDTLRCVRSSVEFVDIQYRVGSPIAGTFGFRCEAATIDFGGDFGASITDGSDADLWAVSGSLNFGTFAFDLGLDQISVNVPQVLTASAAGVAFSCAPFGETGERFRLELTSLEAVLHPLSDTTVRLAGLLVTDSGFSLAEGRVDMPSFTVGGFLTIETPSLVARDLGCGVGVALHGSFGIQAARATIVLGSDFSARLEDGSDAGSVAVEGIYDLADGGFGFDVDILFLDIQGLLRSQASGIHIAYNPATGAGQTILSLATFTATIIPLGNTTVGLTGLVVKDDGFTLEAASAVLPTLSLDGILEIVNPIFGLEAVSYRSGGSLEGTITLAAASALLFPASACGAKLSDG